MGCVTPDQIGRFTDHTTCDVQWPPRNSKWASYEIQHNSKETSKMLSIPMMSKDLHNWKKLHKTKESAGEIDVNQARTTVFCVIWLYLSVFFSPVCVGFIYGFIYALHECLQIWEWTTRSPVFQHQERFSASRPVGDRGPSTGQLRVMTTTTSTWVKVALLAESSAA